MDALRPNWTSYLMRICCRRALQESWCSRQQELLAQSPHRVSSLSSDRVWTRGIRSPGASFYPNNR